VDLIETPAGHAEELVLVRLAEDPRQILPMVFRGDLPSVLRATDEEIEGLSFHIWSRTPTGRVRQDIVGERRCCLSCGEVSTPATPTTTTTTTWLASTRRANEWIETGKERG
jgi:hypothetical protein